MVKATHQSRPFRQRWWSGAGSALSCAMVSPPFEKTPGDAGPPRRTLRCPFRGHISLAVEGRHLGMSAQVAGLASRRATPDVGGQYLSEVTEWQARSVS